MLTCQWCKNPLEPTSDRCSSCGMKKEEVSTEQVTPVITKTKKVSRKKKTDDDKELAPLAKNRRFIPRETPFSEKLTGSLVLGIDPGARYTGIVVRDLDTVLHASTLVRPKEMQPLPWALSVIAQVKEIHALFPDASIAIEGISDPKGFSRGIRAPLNPAGIMRTAAVAGACYAIYPEAVIVAPGGNGTQHESHYPSCLKGRRPKDLAGSSNGAGTRAHEQSAFDVAGKGIKL